MIRHDIEFLAFYDKQERWERLCAAKFPGNVGLREGDLRFELLTGAVGHPPRWVTFEWFDDGRTLLRHGRSWSDS